MTETRKRTAVSSGHYSTDGQTADVLAFLAEHWPDDYAAVLAEFPALDTRHVWQSSRFTGTTTCARCGLLPIDDDDRDTPCGRGIVWDGSWFDVAAMGVDVEWPSWVADACENTGRVSWEDGEPYGDVMVTAPDGYTVRAWFNAASRAGRAVVGETFTDDDGEPWRVLADVATLDVRPDVLANPDDAAAHIADAWWSSGVVDYTSRRDGVVWDAVNVAEMLQTTDIVDVGDVVAVSPWDHASSAFLAHASVVDRGDDDLTSWLGALDDYPIADDETLSTVERLYVETVAENNAPSWVDVDGDVWRGVWTTYHDDRDVVVSDAIRDLWVAAWSSEQDYRGAADAFVDPSDTPRDWRDAIARQSTGCDVPSWPVVDDRGVVELSPTDPTATVCGACGRAWADYIVTDVTPSPSARCPFEDDHDDAEDDDDAEDVTPRPWCDIHHASHVPGGLTCEVYAAEGRYDDGDAEDV